MSSQIAINTLKGGMAPDLDPSVKNENSYDYAENLRYMASIYPDSFVLHTVDGYSTWQYRSDIETARVVGACRIRNYIVLFTTIDMSTYSLDRVYLSDTSNPAVGYETSAIITLWSGNNLYCDYTDYANLEFVSCAGRYESSDNIKVYWATSYRPIRCYNALIGNWTLTGSGSSYLDANYFNLLPVLSSIPDAMIFPEEIVSGELYSGTVFYTASFIKDNLQESIVLPVYKNGLPIYSDDIDKTPPCLIKGDTESVQTNKGVKIRTSIAADDVTFYDKIRLYRIFYATYTSVPTITIVGNYDINTAYIYDTGGVGDGEITLEEFSVISGINYYAKSLESKDNRLFAANIKESVFDVDFDARAYRFNSSGTANIYDDYDGSTLEAAVTSSNWSTIDSTFNCVNLFNSLDYEFNSSYQYKFQSDGTTFGAEGPEIKISFGTQSWHFDDYVVANSPIGLGSDQDNSNPLNAARIKGYQRGEVYRFGIVFYAEDGTQTDVKWICDLKIPGAYEDWGTNEDIIYFGDVAHTYTAQQTIQPIFLLKNGLPSGTVGYKIVRAERNNNDMSVIATGIYSLSYNSTGSTSVLSFPVNSTDVTLETSGHSYNKQVLSFIDPETVFYKENKVKSGDSFIIAGLYSNSIRGTTGGRTYPDFGYNGHESFSNVAYYRTLSVLDDSTTKYIYNIESSNYLETTDNYSDPKYFTIGSATSSEFKSQAYAAIDETYYGDSDPSHFGYNIGLPGRRLIIELDSDVDVNTVATSIANLGYGMIKRNNTSRYGGYDYNSRLKTEYIDASNVSVDIVYSNSGDIYISNFDYLYTQICDTSPSSEDIVEYFNSLVNITFPVESRINLSLRGDEFNYSKIYNLESSFLIREIAGAHTLGSTYSFIQTSDLYLYNTVYSQGQTFKYSYSEENDYETEFDNRIIYSNQKFNDESVDSWTKFKVDNFLDVDGNNGSITAIKNAGDNMYFFQEDGFGVLSINQRSLITDNNAGTLALGTGGILSRYDYISKDKGLQHKQALSESNGTLYWIDENNKALLSFNSSQGLDNLGLSKGLSSYLNKTTISDSPYVFASSRHNEVLFKYEDSKVLVYDTAYQKFPSFYTFQLNYMFDDGNRVVYDVDIDDARLYVLYGDNTAFNKFETTNSYQDSLLRVTCSKDYPSVKTFSHVIMYNRQRDNTYERSGNMEGGWFDSVKFYNTYQYSKIDDLYNSSEAARREKTYVVSIPRNFINVNDTTNNLNVLDASNYDTTRKFREKLRDTHLIAEFTYSPTTASSAVKSDFIIPYIGFGYQTSIR